MIADAADSGITIVAGAGNAGLEPAAYPAAEPGVIATIATDETGVKLPSSNFGAMVAIAAPGRNLLSSYGSADYARWGGTSMATPFAAGGAAILLARYPSLTGAQVRLKMQETATNINALNPAYPGKIGAGLVNLEGLAAVPAPSAETVLMHRQQAGALISWQPVEGAATYDLIRGDVSNLSGCGSGACLGAVSCLANDTAATSVPPMQGDTVPPPGSIAFYLMRPTGGAVPPDFGRTSDGGSRVVSSGDCAH